MKIGIYTANKKFLIRRLEEEKIKYEINGEDKPLGIFLIDNVLRADCNVGLNKLDIYINLKRVLSLKIPSEVKYFSLVR